MPWIIVPNRLYQCTLSAAAYECWHLLHILISIWSNLSFHFSHAGARGNFCIFLMTNEFLFHILISPLDILSWEGRACCCLHIKKKLHYLIDLWDLVHILDIRKSLLNVHIENIFSHFMTCLFTFLLVFLMKRSS